MRKRKRVKKKVAEKVTASWCLYSFLFPRSDLDYFVASFKKKNA